MSSVNGVARAKTELPSRWKRDVGDYVTALCVSNDGASCVMGLGNGEIVGLRVTDGQELFRIPGHKGGVLALSLDPKGVAFVSGGQEPTAKLWDMDGHLLRELPGGGGAWVEHAAWSPRGDRITTASARVVRVWNSSGEPLVELEPLTSAASAVAWRGDGTGLAVACYGGVHILPFVPGAKTRHLEWRGSLISMAWSPDANVIACGSQDASVHFWRLKSGRDSEMTGYPSKPKTLAWDKDSKLLATTGDKIVTLWDFRRNGPEGTPPIQLESHQGLCTCLAFSPKDSFLASGSQDNSVLVWDPRRGTKPRRFAFLDDEIVGLAWHPEQHTLIAADATGNVVALDVN